MGSNPGLLRISHLKSEALITRVDLIRIRLLLVSFSFNNFSFPEGFVEGIRTDGTTRERMPRDGTVFQLTSNVMRYGRTFLLPTYLVRTRGQNQLVNHIFT